MKPIRTSIAAAAFCLVTFALPVSAATRENPVPVRTVAPEYPRELRQQGVSGLVMIKCTVDEQGNVSDTNIVKSSNEAFDKFALDALKKWKFKPARLDGSPISVQVTIPIKFVAQET